MKYKVIITPAAQKQLDRLSGHDLERVVVRILALGDEPRPRNAIKLRAKAEWRMREGDFRVIYLINDAEGIVKVVRVMRRNEKTYRGI